MPDSWGVCQPDLRGTLSRHTWSGPSVRVVAVIQVTRTASSPFAAAEAIFQLLGVSEECQSGRCSCPTDEYQKPERMTVDQDENRITVRLALKPGS